MARTETGARLTAAHHRGQIAIRAQAVRSFTRIWPLWDGSNGSFGRLLDATMPLVVFHHGLSAALAAGYYDAFRAAERVAGRPSPRLAGPLNQDVVRGTLFVTGSQMTRDALQAGQRAEQAMQTALVRTSGTVSRYTLEGGRDTLVRSTAVDNRARGYGRIVSDGACDFCQMLAGRGTVYSPDTADFQAHDHCGCSVEPEF